MENKRKQLIELFITFFCFDMVHTKEWVSPSPTNKEQQDLIRRDAEKLADLVLSEKK